MANSFEGRYIHALTSLMRAFDSIMRFILKSGDKYQFSGSLLGCGPRFPKLELATGGFLTNRSKSSLSPLAILSAGCGPVRQQLSRAQAPAVVNARLATSGSSKGANMDAG